MRTNYLKFDYRWQYAFVTGKLGKNELELIPETTKRNWLKKNFTNIIGFNIDEALLIEREISVLRELAKHKRLLKAAKTMLPVYQLMSEIFKNIPNKIKLLKPFHRKLVDAFEKAKPFVSISKNRKRFGVSANQFKYWRAKRAICKATLFGRCLRKHPFQIAKKEIEEVQKLMSNPKFRFHSVTEIYEVAKRELKIGFSKPTWDKIVIVLGFDKRKTPPYKLKYEPSPKTSFPLERLHLDITEYITINKTKVYISILMDNYSRKVLGWYAFYQKSGVNTKRCLEFLKQYHLPKSVDLIVDGGSENVNSLVSNYLENHFKNIQLKVAKTDVPYSNSMVEAFNKHIKYNYLFRAPIYNYDQLVQFLNFAIPHYNNKPKPVLKGKTPNEVFENKNYPIETNIWKTHCENCKKIRIAENRILFCEKCKH